ncbi:MAG TPA: 4Fe-4S dicluster domain-containing protein [Methanoregulaceae archaeon]|nr:4Fe-4S dicluster domain-containing protein [Methanoregulaceae archaeon]
MAFFEMAKTALRTVVRRPATILYPVEPAKKTDISRGHVVIDESRCISCRLCEKRCPAQAIVVNKEEKTWQIDRLRCVVCRACVDVCPVTCLFMDTQYTAPMTARSIDTITITYVKPPKPEKPSATGEGQT